MRASIGRTELFAFIRMLGGNPYQTCHVEISPDGIKVTAFRLDEQGNRVATGDGEVATDVSTIAIVGSDGDQATVLMRHPNLDTEVVVPATAVGHHAVAGWEVVAPEMLPAKPEPEPAKDVPLEQPAPEDDKPKITGTPRSRRKAKED